MAEAYDVQAIEKKWQDRWESEGTYVIDNDDPRPPYYVLCLSLIHISEPTRPY